tara:strand:- start:83 stop:277 length:195 start_codon:yes stop_codon:yes gene_type:complete
VDESFISRGVALAHIIPRTTPADLHSTIPHGAVTYYDRRLLRQGVVLVDLLVARFLVRSFRYIN